MFFSFQKEDNRKKKQLCAKWSMKMNRKGLLTEFDVGGDIANSTASSVFMKCKEWQNICQGVAEFPVLSQICANLKAM